MKKYLLFISSLMGLLAFSYAQGLAPNDLTGNYSSNYLSPYTSKIVGGVKSQPNAWPSTVALLDVVTADQQNNYQAQFCGGSLVAPRWVLTAAHCVVDGATGVPIKANSVYALVGATNLLLDGQKITVKNIIVYPNYNNNNNDSDLALLELSYQSFTAIPTIPVSVNDAPVNLLATVVGWGELSQGSNYYPVDLYEVEVPIVSRASCSAVYGSLLTQNMICAGYRQGGKDACLADSGGPLMGIQHGKYVQVGLTSAGGGCAQPGAYGIYTRLSNFEGWIKSHTGNISYPSGGLSSWSKFYSPEESGGSIGNQIPFLLFILSLVSYRRIRMKRVK